MSEEVLRAVGWSGCRYGGHPRGTAGGRPLVSAGGTVSRGSAVVLGCAASCGRSGWDVGVAETCRCHLPMVPPEGLPQWWPQRDPEPDERVLAVALYGQDPECLRRVRRREGWCHRGSGVRHPAGPAVSWVDVGRCWAGVDHAVVDATEAVVSAEQRPHLTVITDMTAR